MNAPARPTFGKREKLVSRRLIDMLFAGGHSHSVSVFPVRAVYVKTERETSDQAIVQVLVSVSKRHFKRAVKRNRVKRQIREAYRHNKNVLADKVSEQGCPLCLAFVWQADRLYGSDEVEQSVRILLQRIAEKL